MRPGENGELILQGSTEARTAVLLMSKSRLGSFISNFAPSVPGPAIGYFDFLSRRIEDRIGTGDRTEFVVDDPKLAIWTAHAISVAAMPNGMGFLMAPSFTRTLTRRGYMAEKVREYFQQLSPEAMQTFRETVEHPLG